jgi:large repetitive protein
VSAKLGNGQVTLGIYAPTRKGGTAITGYEYSINDGMTWKAVDASSTALSLLITGLDNGIRYLVKVRAVNGAGGGAASLVRSVTPRTVASAPTNVVLTAGNGRIKVDFETPASNGGAAITSYAYSVNGKAWVKFSSATSPQVIKALRNGVVCSIRVRAMNAAGWGAISESVEATPHR